MSRSRIEQITCPGCKREGSFTIWQSVNTVMDPEMKQKVRDRSAFTYTCPSCGKSFPVDYELLYHQMEDNIMIQYCNNEETFAQAEEFFDAPASEDSFLSALTNADYIIRIVRKRNHLLEKLKIFDCDLDDRLIELVKAVYRVQLRNDPNARELSDILFDEEDGKQQFVLFRADGSIIGTVDADPALMNDIAEKFSGVLPPIHKDRTRIVDFTWAIRQFSAIRPE